MLKVFLTMALFCGSAMADGDQPNGGYTGCTVNCPPPCTENCDPGGGGDFAADETDERTVNSSFLDFDSTDIMVEFATSIYRIFV